MEEVVVISDTEDTPPVDNTNINKNLVKIIDINTIIKNRPPVTNSEPPPLIPISQPPPLIKQLTKIVVPTAYLLTSNINSPNSLLQAVQINNQSNICLLAIPTNLTNQIKQPLLNTTTPVKKAPIPLPPKVQKTSRCWEFKKKVNKVDLDGFNANDRLGFYAKEEARARRCVRILNTHIKVREAVVKSMYEPMTEVEAVLPKTENRNIVQNLNFNRYYEILVCAKQIHNDAVGDETYDVPLNHKKWMYSELINFKSPSKMYFINYSNVRKVDNIRKKDPTSHIFFINEHNVITSLYMDYLPSLKDNVIVIDKCVYDKYKNIKCANKRKITKHKRPKMKKQKMFNDFLNVFHSNQANK